MIRSPITVWRRTKPHSSSVSGPGLPRMASGIATLPTSCSSLACRTCSISSGARPSASAVAAGIALGERAQQHVLALAAGGHAAGVLVRVHPLVGDPQRLDGVVGLDRQRD